MYFVISYNVIPEKATEYQKWLTSTEARNLLERFEKETGAKYVNTYAAILGTNGEQEGWEDWFEIRNWATLDNFRDSKAGDEWVQKTWNLVDQKSGRTKVVRTVGDVKVYPPP